MTLFQYSNNPLYPDRYSRETNWVRVLPVHGRPLQTAELNEMQTILHDNLKQGLNTLFTSGSILSGLRLSLVSTSETDLTIGVSSGQLYVEGIVLEVEAASLQVPLQGEFNIGVLVQEKVITEAEDPGLRDPIKGGALYGMEGASRLVWKASLELNNADAFTIGRVVDGGIIQKELNPFKNIEKILAEYTFERSGNFCVRGLGISSLPSGERAIADKAKYTALQSSVAEAQQRSQQALSDASQAEATLANLKQQLGEAQEAARLSPNSQNLVIVNDLTQRVTEAEDYYNQLARLVVTTQSTYQKGSANLAAAQSLLVDKALFSIAPGVAYVEGYRIHLSTPTTLSVPKSLDTTKVDSAVFVYAGRTAVSLRRFSLGDGFVYQDVKDDRTLLTFTFKKLLYNQQFISIEAKVSLTSWNALSVSGLLDLLVEEFNKSESQAAASSITISSPSISLTAPKLRTLLKNNVVISKQNEDALRFESTSISDTANQITIDVKIQNRDSNSIVIGNSSRLLVDVNDAALSGAGRSNAFQLGFRPVDEVISLTAEVEENMKPVVRGATPGTSDKLGDDTIFVITKVVQGSTVFNASDYELTKQSEILWKNANSQPAPGTTYYVSFAYTRPLAINKDFTLDRETDSIVFIGDTPASNRNFYVDYSYYLAKAGVITLDRDGNVNYILSDSSSNPLPPVVPNTLLPIAVFKLFANGVEVTPTDCRIVNFAEINELAERVKRNTINLETLQLDTQGYRKAVSQLGTNPVGVYTNTLQDLSRLALDNTQFTGTISPAIQAMTGGYVHKDVPIKYETGGTQIKNDLGKVSFVTLPYSNRKVLSQSRLTTARSVSPLPAAVTRRAQAYISPSILFLNEGFKHLTPCDWIAQNTSFLSRTSENKPLILQQISDTNKVLFKGAAEKISESFLTGNALSSLSQDTSSFLGFASQQVTAKPVNIEFKAENLPPGSEGYRLYIAGREITQYTLLSGTPYSGPKAPGTIKVKADGGIRVRFTLPTGLTCGVHVVELISPNGYCKSRIAIYNNLLSQVVLSTVTNWDALAPRSRANSLLPLQYPDLTDEPVIEAAESLTAPGVIPDVQIRTLSQSQKYPVLFDAISQSFELPDYYFLTQVNLKLKQIGTAGKLKLHLREANELGPTKVDYAVAEAQTLNPSESGAQWTTFTFSRPVLIHPKKTYCITVEASQTGYQVFTAEIGAQDLVNQGLIGDQLYLKGTLYTTEDGRSLNSHAYEDLCYEINCASFTTVEQTISLGRFGLYDNLTNVSFFCLNTRDIIPGGTSITYEYKVSTGIWKEFQPNSIVCLGIKSNSIELRARLKTNSSNVSPVLWIEGTSVSLYAGKDVAAIVSKQVNYPSTYTNAAVVVQYIQPSGTQPIKVFISSNDGIASQGTEWIELELVPGSERFIDEGLRLMEARFQTSEPLDEIAYLGIQRTKFRYKLELRTNDTAVQPIVRNVISYVW